MAICTVFTYIPPLKLFRYITKRAGEVHGSVNYFWDGSGTLRPAPLASKNWKVVGLQNRRRRDNRLHVFCWCAWIRGSRLDGPASSHEHRGGGSVGGGFMGGRPAEGASAMPKPFYLLLSISSLTSLDMSHLVIHLVRPLSIIYSLVRSTHIPPRHNVFLFHKQIHNSDT